MSREIAPAVVLVAGMMVAGCVPTPEVQLGPYGNGCPGASVGSHYCGVCASSSECIYCSDVNGKSTCPADACSNKCDSSGGGGIAGTAGSGGTGGGGTGGTGGGVVSGPADSMCPAGSLVECSQPVAGSVCTIQSCTCYANSPTAYCGIYYVGGDKTFYWCGGGYNTSCSSISCTAAAQAIVNHCNPPPK